MNNTKIQWTDTTWNPTTGCDKVSPGCRHCYAGELVETRLSKTGLPQYKDGFYGNVQMHPHKLSEPLRLKKPRRIFVNSMSDLFHENITNEFIAAVFGVMAACPQHTFQILTKRPERMLEWFGWVKSDLPTITWVRCVVAAEECIENGGGEFYARDVMNNGTHKWPLPNVWLGVSVEDQKRADERIPLLMQCPATVRFLSCEPLLGEIHLRNAFLPPRIDYYPEMIGNLLGTIDWVIAGGESGPNARPMHPKWVRDIRDQCVEAGVKFYFKQWGEYGEGSDLRSDRHYAKNSTVMLTNGHTYSIEQWGKKEIENDDERNWASLNPVMMSRVGKKKAGRILNDREWNEFPGDET